MGDPNLKESITYVNAQQSDGSFQNIMVAIATVKNASPDQLRPKLEAAFPKSEGWNWRFWTQPDGSIMMGAADRGEDHASIMRSEFKGRDCEIVLAVRLNFREYWAIRLRSIGKDPFIVRK